MRACDISVMRMLGCVRLQVVCCLDLSDLAMSFSDGNVHSIVDVMISESNQGQFGRVV